MNLYAELKARRHKLLALLIFTILGLAVFSPVLEGSFLSWDDREHLELNPLVTTHNFKEIWTRPYFGLYIPVTYSVWAVIHSFAGTAAAFHVFNVLVHSLCAWLVFLLLARGSKEKWAPWVGAGIFLIHPLQVEAVAWISGTRDLLSGFFGLLTLYFLSSDSAKSTLGSAISFIAGLLSKPTLAVLPAAAYLLQPAGRAKLAVFFALGIFLAAITFWIQIPDLASQGEQIAVWWRPLIALDSLGFYIEKLFTFNLSADYGRSPQIVIENKLYLTSLMWLAAIGAWFYAGARKNSKILKYGMFSVVMLLPVLGVIPFQAQAQSTVADRYVYLAMFGIAGIAAELTRNLNFLRAASVALICFAFLSFQRAKIWESNEVFFNDMFTSNPQSYPANVNLGMIYLFKHEPERAEMHLRQAMKLRPNNAEAAANLASLLWVSGRPQLILRDLEPLLRDAVYMERNRPATRAISMLYRLVARAEASQELTDKARLDYCLFITVDSENQEGRTEVEQFLTARKLTCSP